MRERWRDYELVFIISPLHANDDDVAAIIQRVQQTIEAEGGSVTTINHNPPWGRRKLAYPIRAYAGGEASRRSFSEGFYVLMHFGLFASRVAEVERTLKLTDSILRYLVTVVERKDGLREVPEDDVVEDDVDLADDTDDLDEEDMDTELYELEEE